MMVIAVGLSSYNVALFHLVNHAFYKALLFLGAGSVIHAVADNQDFRKYGGLRAYLPLTYSVMLIASLSLVAFPFMTGFYSKDFILEFAYGEFCFSGIVVYCIATIGAMFTTLYSVKVLYLTFLGNPNGPLNSYKKNRLISSNILNEPTYGILISWLFNINSKLWDYNGKLILNNTEQVLYKKKTTMYNKYMLKFVSWLIDFIKQIIKDYYIILVYLLRKIGRSRQEEDNLFMNIPLIILAIFSIFFGYITKEIFIGLGSAFFADNSLFIHSIHEIMLDTEFAVNTMFKLLPLIFTIYFSILAIIISEFFPNIISYFKLSRLGYNIYGFFNQRFFIELIYNKYISGQFFYKLGGQTTMVLDKGSVELLGPYGLEKSLTTISRIISNLSTGVITNYALYILMGLILYTSFYSLTSYDNSLLIILLLALLSILYSSESYLVNYNTSILNSSMTYGTADTSTWFVTTIKTKVIKIPASLNFSAPEPKNHSNASPNGTSNDVSISNHINNDNTVNNLDDNSVLSYENMAKYKECFDAARENVEDFVKQKSHLMDNICNEVKILERFSNTVESNISVDKLVKLFNSCNYNDLYNYLFHNHFIVLGLTILLGSLIIRFFSGNISSCLLKILLSDISFIVSSLAKIMFLIKNYLINILGKCKSPSADPKINKRRECANKYKRTHKEAVKRANARCYQKRKQKIGGNDGDDDNDPNNNPGNGNNQDKPDSNEGLSLDGLNEVIRALSHTLELLRMGLAFQDSVSHSDIQNFTHLFSIYQGYSNFINQNHPQYLAGYNQALADLFSLEINIVHSPEIPPHVPVDLAAVIVILDNFFNI